jgi:hypothetical protein
MIEYLLGQIFEEPADSLDAMLDRVSAAPGTLPFSAPVMAFVTALTRGILTNSGFRAYPELMAMAHWFRPASLRDLRNAFLENENTKSVFVRRGVVFHIAPSNVDSVFIYSWLISLLCGNCNIDRIYRRRTVQMQAFFALAADLLREEEFLPLAQGNLVLSYDYDPAITEAISARCHLRVVWGGDYTINQIRSVPLPPLATELAFANRFSLAVLNAAVISDLEPNSLETLAQDFYNDAFWFSQQACSSPRAVVWIGDCEVASGARKRFWSAVEEQIRKRQPEDLPAQVMDRVTALFRLAHNHCNARAESRIGALPSRILVTELSAEDRACHSGNGLFIELVKKNLSDIVSLLASRDQTITYFGLERKDWIQLIENFPPHAADRIVPVGEALTFGAVWDGVDLRRAFTREIQIYSR